MLSLDLSPLAVSHFIYLVLAFGLTWAAVVFVLRQRRPWLRAARPQVFFAGVIIIAVTVGLAARVLTDNNLKLSLLLAGLVTLLVGTLDEIRPMRPAAQLLWQFVIAAIVAAGGWVIRFVSSPSGEGVISLGEVGIFSLGFWLTLIWLVAIMNAINWLDGVDGLASGVSGVAFLALAAVSLLPSIQDGRTIFLAAIGGGCLAAFFIWNFSPARVWLGTSGSWWLGLFIGVTAILSGGKIATTLLILSLPVLDAVMVVLQRLLVGQAPWRGDTNFHLHHKLLKLGWPPALITVAAMLVSSGFALAALSLQTKEKLAMLLVAAALVVIFTIRVMRREYVTMRRNL